MKSKKWLLTAGVVLSTTALLVACGKADKEADAPTTFSYVYAVDPASLDYSIATRTSTTDVIGNVVDGLMENDQYGNVIPSLAEDWSVSKDGLTVTRYAELAFNAGLLDHSIILNTKDYERIAQSRLVKFATIE